MQDKEVLDQTEENFTTPSDVNGKKNDSAKERDVSEENGKKEVTKDGKFVFRKMKQTKKEKDKKSGLKFSGEGVSFKAKLIGVEIVDNPRGDKLCQDAMYKLKMNVKNLGAHKRKINIFVSLDGIKIKDDKNVELLYHHPVPFISFISQDITDARAFGYVASSANGQHQFIAIKTEKPAFHVVVALRDLFQTVLSLKQEKMEQAKEQTMGDQDAASSAGSDSFNEKSATQDDASSSTSKEEEDKSIKEENIYFDVMLSEPFTMKDDVDAEFDVLVDTKERRKTVDELLCLQDELNKLQQGIAQMDTSIAAVTYSFGTSPAGKDPFDTSFVTPAGPKDTLPQPMPAPVPVAAATRSAPSDPSQQLYEDKYSVFSALENEPSIFESALNKETEEGKVAESGISVADLQDLEEEIRRKSQAPAKPPRNSKTTSPDLSVFADLDPLGKDRPYIDKKEFFHDVKNPPKKVLNDLLDKKHSCEDLFDSSFDMNGSSPVSYPLSPPELASPYKQSLASSLPNSFLSNLKFSAFTPNGNLNPNNPFERETNSPVSNPSPPNEVEINGFGRSPSSLLQSGQQLAFGRRSEDSSQSSSPIPIPPRQQIFPERRDRALSNGSIGSLCSKSPSNFESPNFDRPGTGSSSPGMMKLTNGYANTNHEHSSPKTINSESVNGNTHLGKGIIVNGSSKPCPQVQNGVSRPRPRSSLSKGGSLPNNIAIPHIPTSTVPSETDVARKENIHFIANGLRNNGLRTRAATVPMQPQKDFVKIPYPADKNIFARKSDPFTDEFFCSLPKKTSHHISTTHIQEYV